MTNNDTSRGAGDLGIWANIGVWIAIGAVLGVVVGVLFDNVALGVALGPALGVATWAVFIAGRNTRGES